MTPPVRSSLASRRMRRVLGSALIFGLLLFCLADLHRFLNAMDHRKPTLKRWLPFASELGQDELLYTRHADYLYPPFFLVLIRPLTRVSPHAAAVVWQVSKYMATVCAFLLTWRLFASPGVLPLWIRILSVVLSVRFVASDLAHGNVNLFICLLVVSALSLLIRRRHMCAGLLIGLAACIKLTPALWGIYLIGKRDWRAVAGLAMGLVIALEVAPLLVLQPQMNHRLLGRWYQHVVTSYVSTGQVYSGRMNQSLVAVSNRLLGRSELAPNETPIPLVELDAGTIIWIQRLCAVALIGVLAWLCRGPAPIASPTAITAEWSMVACVTLILSGYTWTGHFCLLIPAHVVLLAYLWTRRGRRGEGLVFGTTIAAETLFVFTGDLITPAGREWASAHGLPLLGVFIMGIALALVREKLRCGDHGARHAWHGGTRTKQTLEAADT